MRASTSPTLSNSATRATVAPSFRPGYPAPRERVALYVAKVAQRHGLAPATLHKLLHGDRPIPELLRDVIAEAVRDGKRHQVAPFYLLLEAAWREVRSLSLTDGLILQAVVADEDENVHRDAFLINRNDATRRQWARSIDLEVSTKLEVRAHL